MANDMTEEEVKKWMGKIYLSLAWRKPYEDTWDRVLDYLKTKYYKEFLEEDRICINMVHPHVRVVIPAVYSRNPDVMVLPRRKTEFDDDIIRKRAEVMQNLLRYYLKELGVKTEVKLCILDAVLTGIAHVKTGYESEIEKYEVRKKKKIDKTIISDLLVNLGIKSEEEPEEEYKYFTNEKVVAERPWVLRVSPYDVIVPALSRRSEELAWRAERIICSYDEVMADESLDTEGLKPSASANDLLKDLRGAKHQKIGRAHV